MTTPARTPPRLLSVKRITDLSPHLRCITLSGSALADFPVGSDGLHIKLMLPQAHQTEPVLPTLGPAGPIWPAPELRPITRTYSVARFDPVSGELDVLFVLHGDDGPASRWACQAQIGQRLGVAGPAGPALFQPAADWFLLIGDLSSVALIAAVLRTLPAYAGGEVLMEIPDDKDQIELIHPTGIRVRWLSRQGAPAGNSRLLLEAVQQQQWHGQPSVTMAGENQQVVAIRHHLLHERKLPRTALYAVPYWKEQYSEEAYHQERHRIMDELDQQPTSSTLEATA